MNEENFYLKKTNLRKMYFVLYFKCQNLECFHKNRLEDLKFDFMLRGHCSKCDGSDFKIIKERLRYNSDLLNEKIIMIETKKIKE